MTSAYFLVKWATRILACLYKLEAEIVVSPFAEFPLRIVSAHRETPSLLRPILVEPNAATMPR